MCSRDAYLALNIAAYLVRTDTTAVGAHVTPTPVGKGTLREGANIFGMDAEIFYDPCKMVGLFDYLLV